MPLQTSSVSASTVRANCVVSSLATLPPSATVRPDWPACCVTLGPILPSPNRIGSGSMPTARSTKNITTRMRMPEIPRRARCGSRDRQGHHRDRSRRLRLHPVLRAHLLHCRFVYGLASALTNSLHRAALNEAAPNYICNCRIKSWHGNIKSKWQCQSQTETLSQ